VEYALIAVLIGLLFIVPFMFRRADTRRDSMKAVLFAVVLVAIGGLIITGGLH
jgi:hypothetical protein